MRAVDLIVKKKTGGELSAEELEFLIQGFVQGEIPDYQMASFLMAVYFCGMTFSETGILTRVMMNSGDTFDLSDIPGVKVDKHSTGGVGDKVSLILAPLVASCGIPVPMVSGRGLGHTGGTLDKLESIPGFNTRMNEEEFKTQVRKIGVAIIGQTDNFVPADKKLYALRDVTATVESIPLIAASIVSKKAASGAEAFVFDVKTGSGAFMSTQDKARDLALALNGVIREMGRKSIALITDMNQPLGNLIGNSLEVLECINVLKGQGPEDLKEICLELGIEMLLLSGQYHNAGQAQKALEEKLAKGAALEKFRDMILAQGGNANIIENKSLLDIAPNAKDLKANQMGFIQAYDTCAIGNSSMLLGAGRITYDASIDYGVGLLIHKKIGDPVGKGDPLFTLYYRDQKSLKEAEKLLSSAVTITHNQVKPPKLIKETVQ